MSRPRRKRKASEMYPATRTGNIRADIRAVEVDNPYFAPDHAESRSNPKLIAAFVNIRESAVETMFARGYLDKAQKRTADRFRAIYEAMGGAGAGAMDYTRDVVDGGVSVDPISVRQMEAGRELKQCRVLLGERPYELVRKVCGEGHALTEVSATKREKLTMADILRYSLNDLAKMWGIKTDRS